MTVDNKHLCDDNCNCDPRENEFEPTPNPYLPVRATCVNCGEVVKRKLVCPVGTIALDSTCVVAEHAHFKCECGAVFIREVWNE